MKNLRGIMAVASAVVSWLSMTTHAGTDGPLTYTVNGDAVTINSCDPSTVGAVDIPSEIEGKPVAEIAFGAFWDCISVTSVTIPPSVEILADFAFSGCTAVTNFSLSSNVSNIGHGVFSWCWALSSIDVDLENPLYSSVDGVLIDDVQRTLIVCPPQKTGEFIIPSAITNITFVAFDGCSSLTNVVLPEGMTVIGNSAFKNCSSITEITFPSTVSSMGSSVFEDCSALTAATFLGDAPIVFSTDAFVGTDAGFTIFYSLNSSGFTSPTWKGYPVVPLELSYSVAGGVITITDCSANVSGVLKIPSSIHGSPVTAIGNSAFESCGLLSGVTIPSSVTNIADSAFQDCVGLTTITIPSAVSAIGASCFKNCTALEVVTLPAGLTSIGASAFQNCSSLLRLTIPSGVPVIEDNTFLNCALLNKVVLGSSVTHIGTSAFQNCSSLPKISFPAGLLGIGASAFQGCELLAEISVPSGASSIGDDAFGDATRLEIVRFEGDAPSMLGVDVFYNNAPDLIIYHDPGSAGFDAPAWDQYPTAEFPFTYWIYGSRVMVTDCDTSTAGTVKIPAIIAGKPVDLIADRAFENCRYITKVDLPDSVEELGDYAFYGCYLLSSIEFPAGLETIGRSAFSYCRSLLHITIPASVTLIYGSMFKECTSLVSIDVQAGNVKYYSRGGVLFLASDAQLLKYPAMKPGASYDVPVGIARLRDGAFADNQSLTHITLPSGLTTIDYDVFSNCSALGGISLPETVSSIGSRAFEGCNSLAYINVEAGNAHYISIAGGLYNAAQTTMMRYPPQKTGSSYTIVETVTRIDDYAFENCGFLESIDIPVGVDYMGSYAFADCSLLQSMTVPEGVATLSYDTFRGCGSMSGVSLPSSLTRIDYDVFEGCASLTNIVIPSGVTSIEPSFRNCTSLSSIEVEEGNLNYKSVDGVLFNTSGTDLLTYPVAKPDSIYSIPLGVTSIDYFQFGGCSYLHAISIPASVTSIGSQPFFDCFALESIHVETGNVNFVSSDGVLFNAAQTELVSYPPASLNSTYTLPASVDAISFGAFRNSNQLTSYFVEAGSTTYFSRDGVLYNRDQTQLVHYPEGRVGSYSIPSGVISIESLAFFGCGRLTEVTLPEGLTEISSYAFELCSSLTEIELPDSLTHLSYGAFYRCSGLSSIRIPAGVDVMKSKVFWDCGNLDTVRFLGSAPSDFGADMFLETNPDLIIHYSSTNSGFATPTWQGVPATPWFMDNGFEPAADLSEDMNGDGVDLLTAYALNLDPDQNLSGSLPKPVIGTNSISISYYAASPGVTYTIETGVDLGSWTTNGITLEEYDEGHARTGSANLSSSNRFLRLTVEK